VFFRTEAFRVAAILESKRVVPNSVVRIEQWPKWRQLLRRPPEGAKQRTAAWHEIQSLWTSRDTNSVEWPGLRRPGIFWSSVVPVSLLGGSRVNETLRLLGPRQGQRRDVECPDGAFFGEQAVDEFDFDCREIEGILQSKSEQRFFESVPAFGACYAEEIGAPINQTGLNTMLEHKESRLRLKRGGSFPVAIDLWDGRLFLCNSGGSHHFAGASYIAAELDIAVPLRSRLRLTYVRPQAVNWLREQFHILAVPESLASGLAYYSRQLMGSCFRFQVPAHVQAGSKILLLPRTAEASRDVTDLLVTRGARDLSVWFADLLIAQERVRVALSSRFHSRIDMRPLLHGLGAT
jgi:hypothetical protein